MKKILFSSLSLLILFCLYVQLDAKPLITVVHKENGENDKFDQVNELDVAGIYGKLDCKNPGSSACTWSSITNPNTKTSNGEIVTASWEHEVLYEKCETEIADAAGEDYADGTKFPKELTGVVTLNEILYSPSNVPVFVYRTAKWVARSIKDYEITVTLEMLER